MLTNNDLKLFELLDSEIDKELNDGCCLYEENNESSHIYIDAENAAVQYSSTIEEPETGCMECSDRDKVLYLHNCKILGHYPTHADVLRYVFRSGEYNTLLEDGSFLSRDKHGDGWQEIKFKIDLTKTVQNYTEEQKAELIEFINSLK